MEKGERGQKERERKERSKNEMQEKGEQQDGRSQNHETLEAVLGLFFCAHVFLCRRTHLPVLGVLDALDELVELSSHRFGGDTGGRGFEVLMDWRRRGNTEIGKHDVARVSEREQTHTLLLDPHSPWPSGPWSVDQQRSGDPLWHHQVR